jgi:peptidyl-prolyl cis-trans isomerase SurA
MTARLRPLVIVLAVVAVAAVTLHGEIIEQILVKVNGDIITKSDLESRQIQSLRRRGDAQKMNDAELQKALADMTPQIIFEAVDEMLLLQRGRELGYRLSDDQFKQILDNIKKENKIETEEQFQAALKQENLTLADLRRDLEKNMIVSRVQQNEVMNRISVTEDEAKAFYEAHKGEFTTPASMMVREILVAVPKADGAANVAQDEAAKAKAEGLLARLKAGADFEKIVAEASEAASKPSGGLIGPISKDDLDQSLRAIFAPLKAGDLTPVLRTASGYQIFKVDSLTEVKILPFDQAREQIGNRVAETKRMGEYMRYMQKVRTQAVIEWKNPELKKMYDQRLAEEAAQAAKAVSGQQ